MVVTASSATPAALRRVRAWLKQHYLSIAVFAALILVVGIPLLFSLDMSFREGTPAAPGPYTLENYQRAFSSPQVGEALVNTLIYAAAVSSFSLAGATFFAWLIERTDMPFRNAAWVLALLPIAIPGMLTSMGWILLTSSRTGAINVILRNVLSVFGVQMADGPLDIYSFPGLIFVESLRGGTALFIIMVAAFRLMDPSLEEASSVSGASVFQTFRKVTLRLMVPALFAAAMYAFVGNLDDLDGPLIIGLPAGVILLPTLIFFVTSRAGDWGLAAAFTCLFVLLALVVVVFYYRVVIRRSGEFATVSGKAYRPRRVELGRWRHPAFAAFVIYALLTVGLPVGVLIYASLLPGYEAPSAGVFSQMSLDNYTEIFQQPEIPATIANTAQFSVLSAFATMILAFVISWLVVRQRVRARLALDSLAFVPHAIPLIAVVISMVAFYLSPLARWTGLYGTVALMALAMITRTITFGTRTMNSAMGQLSGDLEEAAYIAGVGRIRTLSRITFRLLLPAVIGGLVFVGAMAIRNLTIPLLLSSSTAGTISSEIYYYWSRQSDYSGAAALGVLMILALAVLAFIGRRYLSSEFGGDESRASKRVEKRLRRAAHE